MSVRWTEEQLAEFEGRKLPPFVPPQKAKGVARVREMNKLEAAYAEFLKAEMAADRVLWWAFERMKFILADRTSYTPDFAVMTADGTMEYHETKGWWREDARIKIKIAADLFPFRFVGITRKGQQWFREEF